MIVIDNTKDNKLFIKPNHCQSKEELSFLHTLEDGEYKSIPFDHPRAVAYLEEHVPKTLAVKRLTGNHGLLAIPGKGIAYIKMVPIKDGELKYFKLGADIFYWKPDYIADGTPKIKANAKEIKGHAGWYGVYRKE
jgi:hypothetical protein